MRYKELRMFLSKGMKMSHVYQPVMIRTLLQSKGRASTDAIAKALLAEDRSQIEYYDAIVNNMVGRVLRRHGVVEREGPDYTLLDFDTLTADQIAELRALCESKLAKYIERRGEAIWEHRALGLSDISGTVRYEVYEAARS